MKVVTQPVIRLSDAYPWNMMSKFLHQLFRLFSGGNCQHLLIHIRWRVVSGVIRTRTVMPATLPAMVVITSQIGSVNKWWYILVVPENELSSNSLVFITGVAPLSFFEKKNIYFPEYHQAFIFSKIFSTRNYKSRNFTNKTFRLNKSKKICVKERLLTCTHKQFLN